MKPPQGWKMFFLQILVWMPFGFVGAFIGIGIENYLERLEKTCPCQSETRQVPVK